MYSQQLSLQSLHESEKSISNILDVMCHQQWHYRYWCHWICISIYIYIYINTYECIHVFLGLVHKPTQFLLGWGVPPSQHLWPLRCPKWAWTWLGASGRWKYTVFSGPNRWVVGLPRWSIKEPVAQVISVTIDCAYTYIYTYIYMYIYMWMCAKYEGQWNWKMFTSPN